MTSVTDDLFGISEYPLEPRVAHLAANVYNDGKISTALFGLKRKGDAIPLHDHLHMYGFVRVIRGRVSIESFSWPYTDEDEALHHWNHSTGLWSARYEGTVVLSAADTKLSSVAVLTPKKRNIHSITALDDGTIFFDLLIPGYKGRKCRYYAKEEKYMIRGRKYDLREASPTFTMGRWQYKPVIVP
ncbi:Cysteamine dioxygenase [Aphelenchoides avenae]|nr:Cysteamine dioxygenase [Aphelenchus avenae]